MKWLSFFTTLLVIASCKNEQNSRMSELKSFGYLGLGDTTLASVKGRITTFDDSVEKPLSNVVISSAGNNVESDADGTFKIYFSKGGTFDLKIYKAGYSDVQLINYIADSNQVSDAQIILCRGRGQYKIDISKYKIGG